MEKNVVDDSLQGSSKDPRADISEEPEKNMEEVVAEKPKLVSQATIFLYSYLGLAFIGGIWGGDFSI